MKNRFPAAGALISRLFALAIAGGPATVDAQTARQRMFDVVLRQLL